MEHVRSYYLASNKGSKERGGASISPHFALQSAFMELSDANVEMEAMRLQRRHRSFDLVKCTITPLAEKGLTYCVTGRICFRWARDVRLGFRPASKHRLCASMHAV